MKLADYNFDLPEELIAQQPNIKRISSRLLHVKGYLVKDRVFSELPEKKKKNDLLIVNNTKVMSSRLFGKKITGGKVEILIERIGRLDRQVNVFFFEIPKNIILNLTFS